MGVEVEEGGKVPGGGGGGNAVGNGGCDVFHDVEASWEAALAELTAGRRMLFVLLISRGSVVTEISVGPKP